MKWKVSAKSGLQKVWSFIRMAVWKSEMKMVSEKSCLKKKRGGRLSSRATLLKLCPLLTHTPLTDLNMYEHL